MRVEYLVLGTIIAILLCFLFVLSIYVCCNKSKFHHQYQYINNGLVDVIAIGDYDEIPKDKEISGILSSLPLDKDIKNINQLFGGLLNYKIIPNKEKLHWNEIEIKEFVENDIKNTYF